MDGRTDLKLLEALNLDNEPLAPRNSIPKGGSDSNTGPKGVIADFRQFKNEEREAARLRNNLIAEQYSNSGLRSGWMQRTIESEEAEKNVSESKEDEEDINELIRQLEEEEETDKFDANDSSLSYLLSLTKRVISRHSTKFGRLIFISNEKEYITSIDSEDPETVVIVHLALPELVESRLTSTYLSHLAVLYPKTKFVEYESRSVNIPNDMYPVVMAYRGGNVFVNLVGEINRGMGGFFESDELEEKLLCKGALLEKDKIEKVE